jgi:hypothetical protein
MQLEVTSEFRSLQGQDKIAMTSGEASNPGPPKRRSLRNAPSIVKKHYQRVLEPVKEEVDKLSTQVVKDISESLPGIKQFKRDLHRGRRIADKILTDPDKGGIPVLGEIPKLFVDAVDDAAQTILPETQSTKWVVPEFVDSLEPKNKAVRVHDLRSQDKIGLLGAGSNKGDGPTRKRSAMSMKKRKSKEQSRKKSKKKKSIKAPRIKKVLTKTKGVYKTGPRMGQSWEKMISDEYMLPATLDGNSGPGVEVFNDGLLMNPHDILTPEMQIEVQRWEGFTIRPHIKFDGVSTTVLDGSLLGYYDPDPTDALPGAAVSRFQIAESHGAGEARKIRTGGSWVPNSKRVPFSTVKFWFCDGRGSGPADLRQSVQYRFRCLVYRPCIMYNLSGTEVPVTATINFRISYEITFVNRTLDQTPSNTFGSNRVTILSSLTPQCSATDRIGLIPSTITDYTASQIFKSDIEYLFFNDGAATTLYRLNTGRLPKYMSVTLWTSAGTLTGGGTLIGTGNLASVSPTFSHAVTGSNTEMMRTLLQVSNVQLSQSFTLSGGSVTMQNATLTARVDGGYHYGWYITFYNLTTFASGTDFHLEINEFDEPVSLRALRQLGPATIEGQELPKWLLKPNLPFDKHVAQVVRQRMAGSEDIQTLRTRVRELELTAYDDIKRERQDTKEDKQSVVHKPPPLDMAGLDQYASTPVQRPGTGWSLVPRSVKQPQSASLK